MSQAAWTIFGVGLGLALLATAHVWFWRAFYRRGVSYDEHHSVATADGRRLGLERLRARAGGPAAGAPVILCPGLACNAHLFDLAPGYSLARHLADEGFDVWLFHPRGTGSGARTGWRWRAWRFGFPEYARLDGPAVLARVSAETGRSAVLWVGHSMGGLIGYHLAAGLARGTLAAGGARLAGVVAIGTPLDFSAHCAALGRMVWVLAYGMRGWPVVRLGWLAALIAPLAGYVRGMPGVPLLHVANTEGRLVRRFLGAVVEDVPRRLLDQFTGRILRAEGFDGRPEGEERAYLHGALPPVLALAGNLDQVAPPFSVCAAGVQLGGEVTCETLGGGAEGDFGHLDLVVGRSAPGEVYPRIAAWLQRHRPG